MFEIDSDKTIHVTRGDVAFFTVTAKSNGKRYKFQPNDVVRIKVYQKKNASNVAFQKDFLILEEKDIVDLYLTEADTKIGDVISKPVDYWYEIELNPYTNPQTIIGYDDDGPKIFKLYPEGRDLSTIEREDKPYVDKELSLTSENPIQNQAVARALIEYEDRVVLAERRIEETATGAEQRIEATASEAEQSIGGTATETCQSVSAFCEEAESNIGAYATETQRQMTEFSDAKKAEVEDYSSGVAENTKAEIAVEADKAVERAKSASYAAESSANRAEEAAERAEYIAGADFTTLSDKIDSVSTSVVGWFETPGWYRVAKYPIVSETEGKGISSNSCTLTIKQRYSSKTGEYHELKFISVFGKQEFVSIASKCVIDARAITKARYTYDTENAYLEVYYDLSVANQILFEVTHAKDRASLWKTVTPVATSETIDGVTVTTTYDIPADAKPATIKDVTNRKLSSKWSQTASGLNSILDGLHTSAEDNTAYEAQVSCGETHPILGGSVYHVQGHRALPLYGWQTATSYGDSGKTTKFSRTLYNGVWSEWTDQVGDAAKLGGKDASEYSLVSGTFLSTSILDYALTLPIGEHFIRFSGDSYSGNDLPSSNYKYGTANVNKRGSNAIEVILWGASSTDARRIAVNFYNGTTWSGWDTDAKTSDLANYFKNTGGTINGNLQVVTSGLARFMLLNDYRSIYIQSHDNGIFQIYDVTNGKLIVESKVDGTNTFNGTASGNLPLSGGTIKNNNFAPLVIHRSTEASTTIEYKNTNGILGYLGFRNDKTLARYDSVDQGINYTILDTSNSAKVVIQETAPTDGLWVW